jgi:hypothetical protein
MKANPVSNSTLILRSQVEYSTETQSVILRCILERPATGQRRGFTDAEALLAALRTDLMEMQNEIIPSEQQKSENPHGIGAPPDTPDPTPLTKEELSTS